MKKYISLFLILFLIFVLSACDVNIGEETNDSGNDQSSESFEDSGDPEYFGEYDVSIMFINAGKADSIAVEANGLFYLIDAGEEYSVPMICAALTYMGAEKIEAIFITHPHDDHMGGVEMLSDFYEVGAYYIPSMITDWKKLEKAVPVDKIQSLECGSTVAASDDCYFEVIGPVELNSDDDNDNSMVIRFNANGKTVLFTGDMQFAEEESLISHGVDLKCDILKVGNHGNPDATSLTFAKNTAPKYAFITTDRSVDSDSANKRVTNYLRDADIYITDEADIGYVAKIARDGKISVENAKVPPENKGVVISSASKSEQITAVRNTGDTAADISGWFIYSDRGHEIFRFPDNTVLNAGEEITVACNSLNGDENLIWNESSVWHKSKDDRGMLIDRYGNVISEIESK